MEIIYRYGVLGSTLSKVSYVQLCLEAFLVNEIRLIHLKCKGYHTKDN